MVARRRNGKGTAGKKSGQGAKPASSSTRKSNPVKATISQSGDLTAAQKRAARETLYELVSHTKQDSTICPSQVPRALHKAHPKEYADWRALMAPVRDIVWEEVRAGRLQVTQRGEERRYEDRDTIKGPIRVRRGPEWHVSHSANGSEGGTAIKES